MLLLVKTHQFWTAVGKQGKEFLDISWNIYNAAIILFWQYRNLNNYKFNFERSPISGTENLPSWAALFAHSCSSELWNAIPHLGRQSRDLTVLTKAPAQSMGSDQAQTKL